MIKEVIVVEGKDDIAAVKKAVDAELIATSGFGLNDRIFERIRQAAQRCGVIILTDPDYAGERIRRTVSEKIPGCKHAFLPRNLAEKNGDIGIENASPSSIRDALEKVKTEVEGNRHEFDINDMMQFGLTGNAEASARRDLVGSELGIGYGNAKQFLNRLNKYGVTRDEFLAALKKKGVV